MAGTVTRMGSRRRGPEARERTVLQFLVVLIGSDPLVWRRIQIADDSSFWDFHVAIQDAMGWQDCHLHEFRVVHPETGTPNRIGIPEPDGLDERPLAAGWDTAVSEYFSWASVSSGMPAHYLYDFGDDWHHIVMLEDVLPRRSSRYPRCLAGARACPPEDCGGIHGFADFLEAISDPTHPEHTAMLEWVGASYDPAIFDPASIVFADPKRRWRRAFGRGAV
jgi:hypothetical protein